MTLSQVVLCIWFSVVLFAILASALDMCVTSARAVRVRGVLAFTVTPNLNFIRGPESVILLLFLFLSLYSLEVHFLFIFALGLSWDSVVYRFNFLLSSFAFIFLFKFWRGLATDSLFFSVAPLFSSYLFFSQYGIAGRQKPQRSVGGSYSAAGLIRAAGFAVRVTFVSFFFFFFCYFYCLSLTLRYSVYRVACTLFDTYCLSLL